MIFWYVMFTFFQKFAVSFCYDGLARQAQAASVTSKAGQTKGRADGQADDPNRAKIARFGSYG